MKVHLASCGSGPDAWRGKADRLRYLWSIADKRKHEIVEHPDEADLILISNLRDTDGYAEVVGHPLRKRYPEKCFGIDDGDYPLPLLRGLYTSASAKAWYFGRVRSGSYGLFHDPWKNQIIEGWRRTGAPTQPKQYLFSFIGRANHPTRRALLRASYSRTDILVEDAQAFNIFSADDVSVRSDREAYFANILIASKFALCPRGVGASSIRLFEAMSLGVAPVIVSDTWMPPGGPAWEKCSIQVRERDVPHIEKIIAERESEWSELGQAAFAAYASYFADQRYFNYIIKKLDEIRSQQWLPERLAQSYWTTYLKYKRVRDLLAEWSRPLRERLGRSSPVQGGQTAR